MAKIKKIFNLIWENRGDKLIWKMKFCRNTISEIKIESVP